jgi:hypothetical protein
MELYEIIGFELMDSVQIRGADKRTGMQGIQQSFSLPGSILIFLFRLPGFRAGAGFDQPRRLFRHFQCIAYLLGFVSAQALGEGARGIPAAFGILAQPIHF